MALAVALLFLGFTAVCAQASEPKLNVNLRINASWGGGDILNLDIADLDTGERQQVAIRLSDFISEGENVPYILLQAMDLLGERQSGVIQIENPLFDPTIVTTGATVGDSGSSLDLDELPENLQNIVAEANQPEPPQTLTPDGTGTVVDNIMTVNNIEFFTVTTDNGSDFFLVVDRQRTNNNVYLLNTVTEADLMALAEARGETMPSSSAAAQPPQTPEYPPTLTMEEILQAIQDAADQEQSTPAPQPQSNNSGIVILAVILLVIAGGAFVAWKVLWPKLQNATQSNQNDIEEEDYDDVYDDSDEDYSSDFDVVTADEDDENYSGDGFDESDMPSEDFETVEAGGDKDE
ncbi:MAG: DUF4366 domain-containing protein [Defluviitaleaceae bacterium]|nr:DUF4366 domain-containing protein [Defluviitaleaceae bacterium]